MPKPTLAQVQTLLPIAPVVPISEKFPRRRLTPDLSPPRSSSLCRSPPSQQSCSLLCTSCTLPGRSTSTTGSPPLRVGVGKRWVVWRELFALEEAYALWQPQLRAAARHGDDWGGRLMEDYASASRVGGSVAQHHHTPVAGVSSSPSKEVVALLLLLMNVVSMGMMIGSETSVTVHLLLPLVAPGRV